ncbi:MAG: glycosyltransferase [Chromatiaceae bacterium]|nr:MAG: glycosyltransferase [Chromatiaceae bacterium]
MPAHVSSVASGGGSAAASGAGIGARIGARIGPRFWGWPLALILVILLARLALAAIMPVTQDEAYYFSWARRLAWGYFDHPPGVALLGLGGLSMPGAVLPARLLTAGTGLLSLLLLWRLYRACGLTGTPLLLALAIAGGSLPGLISGVITTPDTVLALCWPLALHEALAALQQDRRRWLSAGLATGLGLLGKYTMLMIGPVFLCALLWRDRAALASRWPWLGGLLALAVFLPNLIWNAGNDWVTLRFQFGHGFATETGTLTLAADQLPAAVGEMAHRSLPNAPPDLAGRLASLAGYLGSQLAFWGLLLIPLGLGLATRLTSGRRLLTGPQVPAMTPAGHTLLIAATLVPLLLFAAVAWISSVEANWAALYLTGAAPLAALLLRARPRQVLGAAAGNLLLSGLYAFHAASAALPLPDVANRVLREVHGYAGLADYIATLPGPVVADRYQFAAMLNFHRPELAVSQWPGISRPSEYSRGRIVPLPDLDRLQAQGFWLLAYKFSPPDIPGFNATRTISLFDCPGQPLVVMEGSRAWEEAPCQPALHGWRVYRYRADDAAVP